MGHPLVEISLPGMKSSLWFVILSYNTNRSELLSIRSALRGHNIIVVDNSDQQGKQFRNPMDDLAKRTVVLTQNHNTGYARGMNTGIEYAYTRGAQWVVLLNDDITLT
jgi:GT2 family glycosyltransferase